MDFSPVHGQHIGILYDLIFERWIYKFLCIHKELFVLSPKFFSEKEFLMRNQILVKRNQQDDPQNNE